MLNRVANPKEVIFFYRRESVNKNDTILKPMDEFTIPASAAAVEERSTLKMEDLVNCIPGTTRYFLIVELSRKMMKIGKKNKVTVAKNLKEPGYLSRDELLLLLSEAVDEGEVVEVEHQQPRA